MSDKLANIENKETGLQAVLARPEIQEKFKSILKDKTQAFTATMLQVVANNKTLANSDPQSIIGAAMTAAVLDMPINPNLGFAYIVPYKAKNEKGDYVDVASFQMGYKGYVQLAQRSGQFKKIGVCATFTEDTEETVMKRLTSMLPSSNKGEVSGYVAYFQLTNGFEAHIVMTVGELEEHGKKYSQTFKKYNSGLWKDQFEGMAKKTVLKLLLSKYAPLSIEMQKAISHDQAVVDQDDNIIYVDNEKETIDLDELNKSRMQELKELFTKEVYEKVDAYDKAEAKKSGKESKNQAEKIKQLIESNPPEYSRVKACIDYIGKVLR